MGEGIARFSPLRRPTRVGRALVLLAGPVLWIAALVVLGYVVRQRDAVGIALLVTAASFAVSIVVLVPTRLRRRREEEAP
jgi:Kef-type K+ transport system membrane component KefB